MKIINIEDEQKKIYVQRKDIRHLLDFKRNLPASIRKRFFTELKNWSGELENNFEEFTEPNEVTFLEGLSWIVDFREVKDLSEKEMLDLIYLAEEEKKAISDDFKKIHANIIESVKIISTNEKALDYKIASLKEIISIKKGDIVIPFPIVPDYKGFSVTHEESSYIAQQGLNPLQVLIFRKDSNTFDRVNDSIPHGLIQTSKKILADKNLENNEFFGDFESTSRFMEEDKYYVTTFKIIAPKEKVISQDKEIPDKITLGKRILDRIYGMNVKKSN